MAKLQADEITIVLPREVYEQLKGVIDIMSQAVVAADAKIKADEQLANADQKGQELLQKVGPMGGQDPLAGLGAELAAESAPRF